MYKDMARTPQHFPIWDKRNTEERPVVKLSAKYKHLLNDKRSDLVKIIEPRGLWPHLRQYHVLNKETQDRMQVSNEKYILKINWKLGNKYQQCSYYLGTLLEYSVC